MMRRVLSLLPVLVFFHAPLHASEAGRDELRVRVLHGRKSIELTIKGAYSLYDLDAGAAIGTYRRARGTAVRPAAGGISVDGLDTGAGSLRIAPERGSYVYLGDRPFRGRVDITRTEDGSLSAINHVGVEDYLKGVLYHEVSHWWPMEALKAQAIAARTYALYQRSGRAGKDFDLTNDIYSQVYGGRVSEKWRTNRAVEFTRGIVLKYNGRIFPAYYHATCGGHTEDSSNLWDIKMPPLKGVKSGFCRVSPHYYWECAIPFKEVTWMLRKAGYPASMITGVSLAGRNSSGRVEDMVFKGVRGCELPAKDFRMIAGPNKIRSTNFTISAEGDKFLFKGRGWGHGVGMCQWGAYFLSKKGYRAEDILRHFYPQAYVEHGG